MNEMELINMVYSWYTAKIELDRIEGEIARMIMEIQETRTIGVVRARYVRPRKDYDYERAVTERGVSMAIIEDHAKEIIETRIDFRAVCLDPRAEIPFDSIPYTLKGDTKVVLEIIKEK